MPFRHPIFPFHHPLLIYNKIHQPSLSPCTLIWHELSKASHTVAVDFRFASIDTQSFNVFLPVALTKHSLDSASWQREVPLQHCLHTLQLPLYLSLCVPFSFCKTQRTALTLPGLEVWSPLGPHMFPMCNSHGILSLNWGFLFFFHFRFQNIQKSTQTRLLLCDITCYIVMGCNFIPVTHLVFGSFFARSLVGLCILPEVYYITRMTQKKVQKCFSHFVYLNVSECLYCSVLLQIKTHSFQTLHKLLSAFVCFFPPILINTGFLSEITEKILRKWD